MACRHNVLLVPRFPSCAFSSLDIKDSTLSCPCILVSDFLNFMPISFDRTVVIMRATTITPHPITTESCGVFQESKTDVRTRETHGRAAGPPKEGQEPGPLPLPNFRRQPAVCNGTGASRGTSSTRTTPSGDGFLWGRSLPWGPHGRHGDLLRGPSLAPGKLSGASWWRSPNAFGGRRRIRPRRQTQGRRRNVIKVKACGHSLGRTAD